MIKSTIVRTDGITVTVECSTPAELVSATAGLLSNLRGRKEQVSVIGKPAKYNPYSRKGKVRGEFWTPSDILAVARIIVDNGQGGKNRHTVTRVIEYLRQNGDVKTRRPIAIQWKIYELLGYLRYGKKIPQSAEKVLESAHIYPKSLAKASSIPSSVNVGVAATA